jgi:hypothetical protein
LFGFDDAVGLRAAEGEAVMVLILELRNARPAVGESGGEVVDALEDEGVGVISK